MLCARQRPTDAAAAVVLLLSRSAASSRLLRRRLRAHVRAPLRLNPYLPPPPGVLRRIPFPTLFSHQRRLGPPSLPATTPHPTPTSPAKWENRRRRRKSCVFSQASAPALRPWQVSLPSGASSPGPTCASSSPLPSRMAPPEPEPGSPTLLHHTQQSRERGINTSPDHLYLTARTTSAQLTCGVRWRRDDGQGVAAVVAGLSEIDHLVLRSCHR